MVHESFGSRFVQPTGVYSPLRDKSPGLHSGELINKGLKNPVIINLQQLSQPGAFVRSLT